jgi:hypothetical protein
MPPDREKSDGSARQAARIEEGVEDRLWHPIHTPAHRAPRSGWPIPQAGTAWAESRRVDLDQGGGMGERADHPT